MCTERIYFIHYTDFFVYILHAMIPIHSWHEAIAPSFFVIMKVGTRNQNYCLVQQLQTHQRVSMALEGVKLSSGRLSKRPHKALGQRSALVFSSSGGCYSDLHSGFSRHPPPPFSISFYSWSSSASSPVVPVRP